MLQLLLDHFHKHLARSQAALDLLPKSPLPNPQQRI